MARKPEGRYWKSLGGFYAEIHGKRHCLASGPDDSPGGPTHTAAIKRLNEILFPTVAETHRDTSTVAEVVAAYLAALRRTKKASTVTIREKYLTAFCTRFGNIQAGKLTRPGVRAWLDDMRQPRPHGRTGKPTKWTDGSERNAIHSIHAMLNWAVNDEILSRNPLKGLRPPTARARNNYAVISDFDWRIIRTRTKGMMHDLCMVLWHSGARPSEIYRVTAEDVNEWVSCINYSATPDPSNSKYTHKTSRLGRARVIYLPPVALEILKARAFEYPIGPLFGAKSKTVPRGQLRPWHHREVVRMFSRLGRKLNIHMTAYSFRHTYITSWISSGRSIEMLAEQVGSTPEVIRKHYYHANANPKPMMRVISQFAASREMHNA